MGFASAAPGAACPTKSLTAEQKPVSGVPPILHGHVVVTGSSATHDCQADASPFRGRRWNAQQASSAPGSCDLTSLT